MSVDLRRDLGVVVLTLLALGLLAFGGWGLAHETGAKWNDPHALIFGAGLFLCPTIPARIAQAIKTVGAAAVDVYRSKTTAGSNGP